MTAPTKRRPVSRTLRDTNDSSRIDLRLTDQGSACGQPRESGSAAASMCFAAHNEQCDAQQRAPRFDYRDPL